jgi:LysM repeat protein
VEKRVSIQAIFLLPILLVFFAVPHTAHASIFSAISDIFSGKSASADIEILPNSQNMALLQAVVSPDSSASTTKADISIIGGTTLSPETQGLYSDGKDHSTETDQISLYVVRKGDTLPAIAKMFGVTTNTILWANSLKGKTVSEGQTLVIFPVSGVQHTVKSGDTLKSITNQYKGDITEVLQYNGLALNSKLSVGDTIFIPDGEVSTKNTSKSTPNNSGVGVRGSLSPVYDGYYMRPIVGGIKTQGIHGHNGVDLASSYGSKIMASAEGDVIIAKDSGWNGGYGEYVVIKHDNGTQTVYGHMSAVSVSVGDHVEQGQTIGAMGSTGKSTGVHVHFEVRGARNPF